MNRSLLVATLSLVTLGTSARAASPTSISDIQSNSGTLSVCDGTHDGVTLTAKGTTITLNHNCAKGVSDFLRDRPNGNFFQSGDFKAEQQGGGYLITLRPVKGDDVTMTIASITELGQAMAAGAKK